MNAMNTLALKKKLRNREPVFGAWMSFSHPSIAEIFASILKPDFLGIDLEHSTISQEESQRIMAAGQSSNVAVLPRVASHNPEQIKRLLDSGADGLLVPMVNSREETNRIVNWSLFPPQGQRSFGVSRAQGYGARFEEYVHGWNERALLLLQIESIQGVEAIDEILDCEFVDGVMIGPYDMSGSVGVPGRLSDPKVLKACNRVIEACRRHHKACGTQIVDPTEDNVRSSFDAGYTFVLISSDLFLMWKWSEKMGQLIHRVRESL